MYMLKRLVTIVIIVAVIIAMLLVRPKKYKMQRKVSTVDIYRSHVPGDLNMLHREYLRF